MRSTAYLVFRPNFRTFTSQFLKLLIQFYFNYSFAMTLSFLYMNFELIVDLFIFHYELHFCFIYIFEQDLELLIDGYPC